MLLNAAQLNKMTVICYLDLLSYCIVSAEFVAAVLELIYRIPDLPIRERMTGQDFLLINWHIFISLPLI